MEKVIIALEELDFLKNYQNQYNQIGNALGAIVLQEKEMEEIKNNILDQLKKLKQDQKSFSENFSKKYGEGTIDLETGEFTKNK